MRLDVVVRVRYLSLLFDKHFNGKSEEYQLDFLKPRFYDLVNNVNIDCIYELMKYKNFNSDFYKKLNNRINDNKKLFVKGMIYDKLHESVRYERTIDTLSEIVVLVIDDIIKDEKRNNNYLNYVDIENRGEGAFGICFSIGSKVIKTIHYNVPNHRRILQPLIRVDVYEFIYPVIIEVKELVDTESFISEEELYNVYKELRDDGIVWGDAKLDNVGRLLKPNKRYFNGTLAYDSKALGFTNDKIGSDLEAGDIVIIDLDFIFKEGDERIRFFSDLSSKFEERYLMEKMDRSSKKI